MTPHADRGVSFTLGYVLSVSIALVLVAGTLVTVGNVVADERARTVQHEADVVGDETAAAFMAADRLVRRGQDSNVSIDLDLPNRLAGQAYTITVRANESTAVVIIRTRSPAITSRTALVNTTPIESVTVAGGAVTIRRSAGGRLTISREDR